MEYIIFAVILIIAIVVTYTTTRRVYVKRNIELFEAFKATESQSFHDTFNMGWQAASNDPGVIYEQYKKFFPIVED